MTAITEHVAYRVGRADGRRQARQELREVVDQLFADEALSSDAGDALWLALTDETFVPSLVLLDGGE